MKFEDIYQFFHNPPPTYLNRELAVCYILDALLEEDSYGLALIVQLSEQFPQYRLSDTVLCRSLKFLEESGLIRWYWYKGKGRGRPRKMYKVIPEKKAQAQELANFWRNYSLGKGSHY